MKTLILIFSIFSFQIVQSQNQISFKVIDSLNSFKINNATVINKTNSLYNYTNEHGETSIKYLSNSDSIIIEKPGYITKIHSIQYLLQSKDKKVFINREGIELEEIIINAQTIPTSKKTFEFKTRKKYNVTAKGKDASIVSSFFNKKCDKCQLEGILFNFGFSPIEIKDIIYIRPLVLNKDLKNITSFKDLIPINKNSRKIIINFAEQPINLVPDEKYYIGFQLINKDEIKDGIFKYQALNKKKYYSLIKGNPATSWYKIDKHTIDYKLFIN